MDPCRRALVLDILLPSYQFVTGNTTDSSGYADTFAEKFRYNLIMIWFILAVTMCVVVEVASATFKKPPFNGSIFGKRSNGITEYESTSRTLAALCEIASEACSPWFPQLEAKKK